VNVKVKRKYIFGELNISKTGITLYSGKHINTADLSPQYKLPCRQTQLATSAVFVYKMGHLLANTVRRSCNLL